MKMVCLYSAIFALCLGNAAGQAKLLTADPGTGLPLIPATDSGNRMGNLAITYNSPNAMPDAQVCKSKFQGNFYSLFKIKVDAAVAWYSSQLPGFKKVQGYGHGRAQIGFYKPGGTVLVVITGNSGKAGENTDAYSVAYERYEPGLSDKAIASLASENIDCR